MALLAWLTQDLFFKISNSGSESIIYTADDNEVTFVSHPNRFDLWRSILRYRYYALGEDCLSISWTDYFNKYSCGKRQLVPYEHQLKYDDTFPAVTVHRRPTDLQQTTLRLQKEVSGRTENLVIHMYPTTSTFLIQGGACNKWVVYEFMMLGKAVDCLERGVVHAHHEVNFRALPTLNPTQHCLSKLELLERDLSDQSSQSVINDTTLSISTSTVIENKNDQATDRDKTLNCIHTNKYPNDSSDTSLQHALQTLHQEELLDSSFETELDLECYDDCSTKPKINDIFETELDFKNYDSYSTKPNINDKLEVETNSMNSENALIDTTDYHGSVLDTSLIKILEVESSDRTKQTATNVTSIPKTPTTEYHETISKTLANEYQGTILQTSATEYHSMNKVIDNNATEQRILDLNEGKVQFVNNVDKTEPRIFEHRILDLNEEEINLVKNVDKTKPETLERELNTIAVNFHDNIATEQSTTTAEHTSSITTPVANRTSTNDTRPSATYDKMIDLIDLTSPMPLINTTSIDLSNENKLNNGVINLQHYTNKSISTHSHKEVNGMKDIDENLSTRKRDVNPAMELQENILITSQRNLNLNSFDETTTLSNDLKHCTDWINNQHIMMSENLEKLSSYDVSISQASNLSPTEKTANRKDDMNLIDKCSEKQKVLIGNLNSDNSYGDVENTSMSTSQNIDNGISSKVTISSVTKENGEDALCNNDLLKLIEKQTLETETLRKMIYNLQLQMCDLSNTCKIINQKLDVLYLKGNDPSENSVQPDLNSKAEGQTNNVTAQVANPAKDNDPKTIPIKVKSKTDYEIINELDKQSLDSGTRQANITEDIDAKIKVCDIDVNKNNHDMTFKIQTQTTNEDNTDANSLYSSVTKAGLGLGKAINNDAPSVYKPHHKSGTASATSQANTMSKNYKSTNFNCSSESGSPEDSSDEEYDLYKLLAHKKSFSTKPRQNDDSSPSFIKPTPSLRLPSSCKNLVIGDSNLKMITKRRFDHSGQTEIRTFRGCHIKSLTDIIENAQYEYANVDKVSILVGTNDCQQSSISAESITHKYEMLIKALKKVFPNAHLSFNAIPPQGNPKATMIISHLNQKLENICRHNGVHFSPCLSLWMHVQDGKIDSGLLQPDGIHFRPISLGLVLNGVKSFFNLKRYRSSPSNRRRYNEFHNSTYTRQDFSNSFHPRKRITRNMYFMNQSATLESVPDESRLN